MRVGNFSSSADGKKVRVSATVTWEDCDRPQRQIYIETDARFAGEVTPNPNAFLLAAIMPAMHHDEHRILISGKICPQLRNGLITAMEQMRQWYGEGHHRQVRIEAAEGFEPPMARRPPRTASFLSGGVDAMATLRSNRLDYPRDHPGSIRDCIFVHGLDVGGYENLPDNRENSELAISSLSELAGNAQVTLIPVFTNMRYLDDNDQLFFAEWYGAALAAIAHVFSLRITQVLIAAGSSIADLGPIGSHPLLDSNYSSAALCIQHDGVRFSRLEKVGLIGEWDAALKTLRACFDAFRSEQALNCGKCEKCIRTMTELLVQGKLSRCRTYPLDDISAEILRTIKAVPRAGLPKERKALLRHAYLMLNMANTYYWRELVDPLRRIGRDELADVVEEKLAEYDKYTARVEKRNWRRAAKRLDRKYFGGTLSALDRFFRAGFRSRS